MANKHTLWLRRITSLGHPYKKSLNRHLYEEIAEICDCTPDRVYQVAHGAKCKSFIDDGIMAELKRCGLLQRR